MLRVFRMVIRTSILQLASHRANLFFEGSLTAVRVVSGLVALAAVFSQTDNLAGWSLSGTIVLLGTYQMVGGLVNAFVQPNLGFFSVKIRNGSVDDMLLKPVPSIFTASMGSCSPWQLLQVVMGAGVVVTGLMLSGPALEPWTLVCYLVQLAAGLLVAWSYLVVLASIGFWDSGLELNLLYNASWQLGRFPADVYHTAITRFLTFIVPVAFISTYPARTLAQGSSFIALGASILAGALCFVFANSVWRAGTGRYTSATS